MIVFLLLFVTLYYSNSHGVQIFVHSQIYLKKLRSIPCILEVILNCQEFSISIDIEPQQGHIGPPP